MSEHHVDHAPLEFAAVHVILGISRIVIVVELDESKRLWLPDRWRDDTHRAERKGPIVSGW